MGELADELGCSWQPVNESVRRWGSALLAADTERISQVEALGLDETLMGRWGRFRARAWSTSIVDVGRRQLLDIVPGRTADGPTRWLMGRPRGWLDEIRWAVLDRSGPYRAAFDTAVPDSRQVADPFDVVRLGNKALDEVRRRVHQQTLGHRDRKHDPLYRARKPLVSASGHINDSGRVRLRGLLDAGDPYGEVRDASHAKETLRSVYDTDAAEVGAATVAQLAGDLQDTGLPQESTSSAAPSGAGEPRSPPGTPRELPTRPPRPPSTTSNASNAPRSGSPTSPTESAHSSTPANPTGHSSTPQPDPERGEPHKRATSSLLCSCRLSTTPRSHRRLTPLRSYQPLCPEHLGIDGQYFHTEPGTTWQKLVAK